ncbi:hypothetical protein EGW08_016205 [Elysia chlorotica]|uniref:WSC domain-containing protein n=1 Tax=Elysia chlorotica TaxID=188477 RepID=A0A433T385_ELYCH|nr:hypothetical protein EGW08_016205 [Elysia chlorotica]
MRPQLPKLTIETVLYVVFVVFVGDCQGDNCEPVNYGYHVNQQRLALRLGCYHIGGLPGAFPDSARVNLTSEIDWALWQTVGHAGDIIKKCAELALQRGDSNFGVQGYGECYLGDVLSLSDSLVSVDEGCARRCRWDVGGPDTMVMYNLAWRDWHTHRAIEQEDNLQRVKNIGAR